MPTPLEHRLTLNTWFAKFLGYESNEAMLDSMKAAGAGWGALHNKVLERMRSEDRKISPADWALLEALDIEICRDWSEINRQRQVPIKPKYFQYLASLSSALFFHQLVNTKRADFIRALNRAHERDMVLYDDQAPLNKLAFWMATGSGKTLLMHIHYHQFMRHQHDLFVPDNILLITPSIELSRQHIAEMQASGIPCFRHGEGASILQTRNAVRVIEIGKFYDEDDERRKKSKGESIPVEAFSGRNLVFVDEGHKGTRSEKQKWFKRRDKLSKDGFVFEYSATFGQALNAANDAALAQEYARAIAFDYSYRFFHRDGYGKDFKIINVNEGHYPAQGNASTHDLMMLGNLLAFFQQQWAYKNHDDSWLPYLIEKPLLLLLGTTVKGSAKGKSTNGDASKTKTDMVNIIAFLSRVVADKNAQGNAWLLAAVEQILTGQSGIQDEEGKDLFTGCFTHLAEEFGSDYMALCAAMRSVLFRNPAPADLHFHTIKKTKGESNEIHLKVGEGGKSFALIYIGGGSELCNLVKEHIPAIVTRDNKIEAPAFPTVHESTSDINILMGAKKFIEGWSSWRVSGMGLLNVGQSEGAQIIQLFGRGVRLKGKDFSLKRSSALAVSGSITPPSNIGLLETLNIFAIRAEFMGNFRKHLRDEGVETTITLPIKFRDGIADKGLQTLDMPAAQGFAETVVVENHEGVDVVLDMSTKTQTLQSQGNGMDVQQSASQNKPSGFSDIIPMLDFDYLYHRLLEYKDDSQRNNLLLQRKELPAILGKRCKVLTSNAFGINAYTDMRQLHYIAFSALRKYIDKLYYRQQRKWETHNAQYVLLFNTPIRAQNHHYEISVRDEKVANKVREMIRDYNVAYCTDSMPPLPRLNISQHIYIPLLIAPRVKSVSITPPGLTDSEVQFVENLQSHIEKNPLPKGREVFLLRNEGKGKGVGFYEDEGFFPDFILWIKEGKKQRMIFVEPHGMRQADAAEVDHKARLWEKLQAMTVKLGKEKKAWKNISMDSFIISWTPYAQLRKKYGNGKWSEEEFAKHHILFAEDGEQVIADILASADK